MDRFNPHPINPLNPPTIYPMQPGGPVPGYPLTPVPPDYKKWGEKNGLPNDGKTVVTKYVTQEQFDELKKEVLEMKELMKKAIKYDEEHNEPHCENEEKYAVLRKIAEMVGVSLDDVIGHPDHK